MSTPEIRLQPVEGWRHYDLIIYRQPHWRVPHYVDAIQISLPLYLENDSRDVPQQHAFIADLLTDLRAGKLRGAFYLEGGTGQRWDGLRLEARCSPNNRTTGSPDDAPPAGPHLREGRCHCGIYLVPKVDLSNWLVIPRWHFLALYARCRGWGYVVEHEKGWRCEVVEIQALYLFMRGTALLDARHQLAEALVARYPVPIAIITFPEESPNVR